jgi:hypothetical protein
MRIARMLVVAFFALSGCRSTEKWAIRVPRESRVCTQDCEGAPDNPAWRECIAACGGEVAQADCGGTWSKPRPKEGCRETETSAFSIGRTIVLVVLLVVGGSVVAGSLAARNP